MAAGETTCTQLVDFYLNQIENQKQLNAFLEVFADEAKARAEEIDKKIKSNSAGKLAGAVIAIKDVLCYAGHKVSASSKILQGFESLYTGTAVQRLLDEDAIIIGRTNCDEFAMGSSNENSAYGNVLNAADNSKVPGGSSGGSAVAVQADMCLASLGTDTGGSVRQPASFCGIVGIKPTYGRISRYGVIAYASSFDQIGVFAHTVSDAAAVLEVISGADEMDSTTSQQAVPAYSKLLSAPDFSKLKIAYLPATVDSPGLDEEIKQHLDKTLSTLKQAGATINAAEFELLDYLIPAYYVLTTAEASSNLARYDGVHFGWRSPDATDLESVYVKTRSQGFGKEVQRRIMLGTFVLSEGFFDAYYTKAQKVRAKLTQQVNKILEENDFILLPTTPTTAFELGAKSADPVAMYLNDIYTVMANLTGMPAISIPTGTHSNGLPFGLQIVSARFTEEKLLAVAEWCQQNIK